MTIEAVTKEMTRSLRGELTESAATAFEHPGSHLPSQLAKITALGYAIAHGNVNEVRDFMQADREWLLNEADYAGNTPLVR